MSQTFEPVSLGGSTSIQVRYFLGGSVRARGRTILIIRCEGTCRTGDAGESDGRFLHAMGQAGLTAWEPDGLVIDLTRLDCPEIVDGLSSLFAIGAGVFGTENLPVAVVLGAGSEGAVGEYYRPINAHYRIEAQEGFFHDMEAALAHVESEIVRQDSIFGPSPGK